MFFSELMKKWSSNFEIAQRDNGDEFVRIANSDDEEFGWHSMRELHQACDAIEDHRTPDDWVYDVASCAADILCDADNADAARDRLHEVADAICDVYNQELAKWLAANVLNFCLVDEACEVMNVPSHTPIATRIRMGQAAGAERIAAAMIDHVESLMD